MHPINSTTLVKAFLTGFRKSVWSHSVNYPTTLVDTAVECNGNAADVKVEHELDFHKDITVFLSRALKIAP